MKFTYNLQLHADNPATYTEGVTNLAPESLNPNVSTDEALESQFDHAFHQRQLITEAGANMIFHQLAQKSKSDSKTVAWHRAEPFKPAINPLREGLTPDGMKMAANKIEAFVKQYGAYTCVSDIALLTALHKEAVNATTRLADQAANTIDLLDRNAILAEATNVMYATLSGTSAEPPTSEGQLTKNHVLSPAAVIRAVRQLRRNNVKTIDGYYVLVIHPDNEADLMLNKEFIEAFKYADQTPLFKGEIGKIHGARVLTTTNTGLSATGQGGIGVYHCLMLGADAFGSVELEGGGMRMIAKPAGSGGTADPLEQRSTIGWKTTHAAKVLDEKRVVKILCASDNSDGISDDDINIAV